MKKKGHLHFTAIPGLRAFGVVLRFPLGFVSLQSGQECVGARGYPAVRRFGILLGGRGLGTAPRHLTIRRTVARLKRTYTSVIARGVGRGNRSGIAITSICGVLARVTVLKVCSCHLDTGGGVCFSIGAFGRVRFCSASGRAFHSIVSSRLIGVVRSRVDHGHIEKCGVRKFSVRLIKEGGEGGSGMRE